MGGRVRLKGQGRSIIMPGKVGVLVREVRANVYRLDRALAWHDRRCWQCQLAAQADPQLGLRGDVRRCEARSAILRAWCAEHDERQALEWLLGLTADLPDYYLRDWGLLPAKDPGGPGDGG